MAQLMEALDQNARTRQLEAAARHGELSDDEYGDALIALAA